jgi:modulator of FtsH protease HflK
LELKMALGRTEKAAWLSIGVGTLLVFLKYGLSGMTGSVALKADAWHSASDVLVSVFVLAGVWITKKGWKVAAVIENAIALAISGLIFSAAFILARESLAPNSLEEIRYLPIALTGTVVSAALSRFVGQYQIRVGREENSPSLKADGQHSMMDFYTTAVVTAGLLGQVIGLRLDRFAAALVVVFVAEAALEVAVGAIRGLYRQSAFGDAHGHDLFEKSTKWIGGWLRAVAGLILGRQIDWSWNDAKARLVAVRGRVLAVLVLLAAIFWLLSGFFSVPPHQQALVKVFGKARLESSGPGLHYAPPAPIGRVIFVDTSLVRRMEIGFRSKGGGWTASSDNRRSAFEWHSLHLSGKYQKIPEEGIMLTGDENLLDMDAVVLYQIVEPTAFVFGFTSAESLVRAKSEYVLRRIVAEQPIETILTGSRAAIQDRAVSTLQTALDDLHAGVSILAVELQDLHPPVEAVDAFREVASAAEDKALTINQAYADQNQRIPDARARAVASLAQAEAHRTSKVNEARGDATRFKDLVTEYRRAQDVTAFRLYIEAMEQALPQKRKFIVSPNAAEGALDLRIFARGQPTRTKDKQ